jgi:hypothetical protein
MKKFFFLILIALITPFISSGQWSTNPAVNNPISSATGEQAIPKIATCPNGDSYIGFFSMEGGNYNVRLQRLDAQGNILWTNNGILISNHPQMTWLTDWDMTADNANHAILTFQDIRNGGNNNVVAYRISPSGGFIWGADGIALSNSTAFNAAPKVCATAAGNAVFAWQADEVTIIQKVSPTGSLMWGSAGITLSGSEDYTWPQLLPVGTDEVILKYYLDSGSFPAITRHIYAQRYNAAGNPVWTNPAAVSTAGGLTAWTQVLPFISDGSDGFFIAWHDQRFGSGSPPKVYVQHINSSGQAVFTTNGVSVSSSSYMLTEACLAFPPGSSDIYVFYNEIEPMFQSDWGIYGQKISSTGTKLWGNNGLVVIPVSEVQKYIVDARKSSSDVVVFYEEYLDAVNIVLKATRLNTSGGFVWTPQQKDISTVVSEKVHPVVNEFANNQWIMSWEDNRNAGDRDIYAQNIQLNGDLGPYIPDEGTIQGTVTLIGGSATPDMVTVTAGDVTTNPDAAGFYSMVVPGGTYSVTGSLVGYIPDTVFNVVAVIGDTTSGVNLTLQGLPTGYIEGTVILLEGTGDVTEVEVSAGYHTVNPDSDGDYIMQIEIGTYNVTASLEGYVSQTIAGVNVLEGQTTPDVDFALSLIPTTGFIEGMVELTGGSGDVTEVEVSAGPVTVNPDTGGYYILEATGGTWDVSASLEGYYTQVIENVLVIIEDTTSEVDFDLQSIPNIGYIEGMVSLFSGTGDVTLTEVTAGFQLVHPSADGHYYMGVEPGTYTVMATHPYTLSDSVTGVTVAAGQTVSDVDFELEVVRADLVCKAVDTYNNILNYVDVEIIGPEGTYNGTITDDSLVFENVPYGNYSGTAWMEGGDLVYAESVVDQNNHYMIFVFDLTGFPDRISFPGNKMKVHPNPSNETSIIGFSLDVPGNISLKIYSLQGIMLRNLSEGRFNEGEHIFTWDGKDSNGIQVSPGLYMIMLQTPANTECIGLIRN